MEKIIIYTNETCPYCKQIKEELTNNNIEFENKSTLEFKDEWSNIISLTGMPTIPTIYYKENYFVAGRDFNNALHLINIIKEFKPCNFSKEQQTLEKIKTLNYGINMAFNKVDTILKQIENKLNINENEHKSTN